MAALNQHFFISVSCVSPICPHNRHMPLVLYDARCPACTLWVRFIARRDGGRHTFVPMASPYGKSLCTRFRINPRQPGNLVLIQGKRARYRAVAILIILGTLPGYETLAATISLLPKDLLSFLYTMNRRAFFVRYKRNHTPPYLKPRLQEKLPQI